MHRIVELPIIAHSSWNICRTDCYQIRYDICEFKGLKIDTINRVHSNNRFSISIGSIGKATELWISTNSQQVTNVWLWQSIIELWHWRWSEYEIVIASSTDIIHDLEKERWLFVEVVDHFEIDGPKATEDFLPAFDVGLVYRCWGISSF